MVSPVIAIRTSTSSLPWMVAVVPVVQVLPFHHDIVVAAAVSVPSVAVPLVKSKVTLAVALPLTVNTA